MDEMELTQVDVEALMGEVERYLDAVALFRRLGHEPRWRTEGCSYLRSSGCSPSVQGAE